MFLIAVASLENEPAASYPFLAKENDARGVIIREIQSPADDYGDEVIYGKPGQDLRRWGRRQRRAAADARR